MSSGTVLGSAAGTVSEPNDPVRAEGSREGSASASASMVQINAVVVRPLLKLDEPNQHISSNVRYKVGLLLYVICVFFNHLSFYFWLFD